MKIRKFNESDSLMTWEENFDGEIKILIKNEISKNNIRKYT